METIADLSTKLDNLTTAINALPAPAPPVADQADLDALGVKVDAATAAVAAKVPPPTS